MAETCVDMSKTCVDMAKTCVDMAKTCVDITLSPERDVLCQNYYALIRTSI
jgi:hypothetical protein